MSTDRLENRQGEAGGVQMITDIRPNFEGIMKKSYDMMDWTKEELVREINRLAKDCSEHIKDKRKLYHSTQWYKSRWRKRDARNS